VLIDVFGESFWDKLSNEWLSGVFWCIGSCLAVLNRVHFETVKFSNDLGKRKGVRKNRIIFPIIRH